MSYEAFYVYEDVSCISRITLNNIFLTVDLFQIIHIILKKTSFPNIWLIEIISQVSTKMIEELNSVKDL